jgi:hypothetical protein
MPQAVEKFPSYSRNVRRRNPVSRACSTDEIMHSEVIGLANLVSEGPIQMNAMEALVKFLTELEKNKVSYRLEHNREETIMVLIAVPGERWEIEFFADGRIEKEVFGKSSGVETSSINELLSAFKE